MILLGGNLLSFNSKDPRFFDEGLTLPRALVGKKS